MLVRMHHAERGIIKRGGWSNPAAARHFGGNMDQLKQIIDKNLDKYKLGIDDTFQFKCRGCGKCCINRANIVLSSRDLYNIASKLGMTMGTIINKYCDTYIGSTSRIPIVRLLPVGNNNRCPLLNGKRCAVYDVKPTVCAMHPLGRVLERHKDESNELLSDTGAIYFLQPVKCGSRSHTNTVRSWFDQYGIPLEDEFYKLWHKTVIMLSKHIKQLESDKASPEDLIALRIIAFSALYTAYDTGEELMPQFRENTTRLKRLLCKLKTDTGQLKTLTNLIGSENAV